MICATDQPRRSGDPALCVMEVRGNASCRALPRVTSRVRLPQGGKNAPPHWKVRESAFAVNGSTVTLTGYLRCVEVTCDGGGVGVQSRACELIGPSLKAPPGRSRLNTFESEHANSQQCHRQQVLCSVLAQITLPGPPSGNNYSSES